MTIHFHRDLEAMKSRILDMGGLVEAAVDKAISSLIVFAGMLGWVTSINV